MKTYEINKGQYLVHWMATEGGLQQPLVTRSTAKAPVYEAYFKTREDALRSSGSEAGHTYAGKELTPVVDLDFSPTDDEYRSNVTSLEVLHLILDEDGELDGIEEVTHSEDFWIGG